MGSSPVSEEAKVANADKAFGKQVQQEAAQELIEGDVYKRQAHRRSFDRASR